MIALGLLLVGSVGHGPSIGYTKDHLAVSDCVKDGRANASCFGTFNNVDTTEMIQAALSSNASYLYVENMGAPWIVRPLFIIGAHDMVVEFESGCELLAKTNEFHGKNDCLLSLKGTRNITVVGNGATLRMRRDDYAQPPRGTCPTCSNYTKAEWRSGISLDNCDQTKLQGLTVVETGGDGLYVTGSVATTNTHVVNCVFDRNYRQGISVISAQNMLIEQCVFSNTAGTAPEAGIDLEPDMPHQPLINISFVDCASVGNAGAGFQVYLGQYNASAAPFSISLDRYAITGGGRTGFSFGNFKEGVQGSIAIRDSTSTGTPLSSIYSWAKSTSSNIRFSDCTFANGCRKNSGCIPILLSASGGYNFGNFEFDSCNVVDDVKRPYLNATNDGQQFINVTARDLVVQNPYGCTAVGDVKLSPTCQKY